MSDPRSTTIAVALGAASVTVLLIVLPWTEPAYRSASGHAMIETAAALIALLVSYLVLGRFARDGQLTDLILGCALVILAMTNLAFAVIPASGGSAFDRLYLWTPVGGRLLGALGFAAAAVAGSRRILNRPHGAWPYVAGALATLVALAVVLALAGSHLPVPLDPAASPPDPANPELVGNAALLVIQLVSAAFYAVAAVGFTRRSARTKDELLGWFGLAAVLAAFANLNYFLFPSLYSEWVYTGDLFRIATYVVLFVGAVRQIASFQRELAGTAVLEERRRLARELHDGLSQELAFISSQSRWLAAGNPDKDQLKMLSQSAQRALDESRSAIAALTRPLDEPLETAVAQAAEEVADRVGVKLRLDLEPGLRLESMAREGLLRIVREAVHAARHGDATTARVTLAGRGGGVCLQVDDDGTGFDPDDRRRMLEFGVTSMRERAEALGGSLQVRSSPGKGTEIEVVIP